MVPLQACVGWAKTVNCHAHPRILLPQNRCLPHLLAAPFQHQPEPRCNTRDFASKVVCQRAFRRSLESSRQSTEEMNVQIANWSISKEKYRSRSAAMISSGIGGKIDRVCCGGGKSFHGEQTLTGSYFITNSVGFVTESVTVYKVRQDGFANFIAGMR